ncbi:hypothetical protein [Streptomyces sp. NBC_01538]|uniref:hypothetical protein n=1 Tax=Streptomyces sp. NBC_01538 TaxID=2903897 RepID=UPI003863A03B
MPETTARGLRHVEHVMGTVFPLGIRDKPTTVIRRSCPTARNGGHQDSADMDHETGRGLFFARRQRAPPAHGRGLATEGAA